MRSQKEVQPIRALLIDDSAQEYRLLHSILGPDTKAKISLDWEMTFEAGLNAMARDEYDVYLVDYNLGDQNGLDLIRDALTIGCKHPIIMITGYGGEETDMLAMEAGAADFLEKNEVRPSILRRTIRNAVERARTLAALQASEEKYRDLFENASDLIQSVNAAGRLEYVNRAWRETLGYADEEISRLTIQDFVHPDHLATWTAAFRNVMAGGEAQKVEVVFLTRERRPVYVEGNINCRMVDGKPAATRGIFRDISERKQADEALRFQASILENISDAVVVADPHTLEVKMFNRAAERVYGWTAEEALTRTTEEVLQNQFAPQQRELLRQLINERGYWNGAVNQRRKDGSLLFVTSSVNLIRDANGQPAAIVGINHDITSLKQTEEALRESEQHYRVLFEGIDDSIIIHDTESNILEVNTAAIRRLGYSREELLSMKTIDLDVPEYAAGFHDRLEKQLEKGFLDNIAGTHIAKDGRRIEIDVSSQVISFHGQTAVLAVVRDVTERKQAELALRESEARNRALLEASPDLMFRITADGTYIDYKAMADNEFYLPPQEFLGQKVRDMMPPDLAEITLSYVSEALRVGRTQTFEYELPVLNGQRFYEARIAPCGKSDVICVVRDITERKQMEQTEREQRMLLEALLDNSITLTSTLNFEEVLDRILRNIGKVVPHDSASIMLLEEGKVHVVRASGYEKMPDGLEFAKNLSSIAAQTPNFKTMAETGQPLVISDVHNDPNWVPHPWAVWIRSYAGMPISVEGEVIGFLNLDSGIVGFFTQEIVERLSLISSQIAIAIHNAQLYAQANELAALNERQRLARELHDAVSQTLFSASMIAETLPRLWPNLPDDLLEVLMELYHLTRQGLAELRSLLLELRPRAIVDASVEDLFNQLNELFGRREQAQFTLSLEGKFDLPPDVKLGLYRIAQEALNNIAKHAHATRITVRLAQTENGFQLDIEDNGRGFDLSSVPSGHYGLEILSERASSIGGSLCLTSERDVGTKLTLIWSNDQAT